MKRGELPTLNGTPYVLTEFLPLVDQHFIHSVIRNLQAMDMIPVIAHAERYLGVFSDMDMAKEIHEHVLIQVNAYSLMEEENVAIRDSARMLLGKAYVDFIGSDAHRITHRAPNVGSGIQYIKETCDKEYVRNVLWNNAKRLLRIGNHEYLDGLLGLATGDALGVPYENCSLQTMTISPCTGMKGYGSHQQPAGSWSDDDTSMAL